jgi:ribosome biogenesis GTPase / thiamine phosphate phosphatase
LSENLLSSVGLDERVSRLAADFPDRPLARVARVDRGRVVVCTADGHATLPADPRVVTGDWVLLDPASVGTVLPRRTQLVRASADGTSDGQPLAANVDRVLVVVGLDQGLHVRRLERLLAVAFTGGADPVVVLNKIDVAPDPDGALAEATDIAVGVEVVAVSGLTRLGIDAVRAVVGPGVTAAVIGASGAGKSTLVNALVGTDVQDTDGVRANDRKGRHTTVSRDLVPVPGGGVLIDTPGLRGVGLWRDDGRGLDATFADIVELAVACRFRDCAHASEPGCAVRSAIDDGYLRPDRLDAFRTLTREVARATDRADQRRAERRAAVRRGRIAREARDFHRARRGD